MESTMSENKVTPDQKPGLLSVIKSILAAGIGVQSDKNRQRDFEQGNPFTPFANIFLKLSSWSV